MQSARAAKLHQYEVARVVPTLDGNMSKGAFHVRVHDLEYAKRRCDGAYSAARRSAHLLGKLVQTMARALLGKWKFPTKQSCAGKVVKYDVRIGDRRQNRPSI